MTEKIRVLIVDDHEIVLQGLKFYLSTQSDIEVVGTAQTGEEAIKLAVEFQPNVIIMDLVMPGMDGIEAAREIKNQMPDIAILALTSFVDQKKVLDALNAGVSGYVTKNTGSKDFVAAIKSVANGEIFLSTQAAKYLAQYMQQQSTLKGELDKLTEREIEIVRLVAQGLNNKEIALRLDISIKTVKTHISNILQKLNLDNRTQIALFALRHNLIDLS
ncbi:MAG: response regulator transcription factor [Candidatus Methanomethylicaceae archaeon]